MTIADLLADAFSRVRETVAESLEGLSADQLATRPPGIDGSHDPANSVAWLVWHLTRIQDDHVAEAAGRDQIWLTEGWVERFGLPLEPEDHGFGHSSDQVGAVRADAGLLLGYHDAVFRRTLDVLPGLVDSGLDRIVDPRWDPPVTLGVRLVSVLNDDMQHAGQAAYVAGLLR